MVQLVGDARGRVDQIRAVLHDLGASAALVGNFAQGRRVHASINRLRLGRVDRDRVSEPVAAEERRSHVSERGGAGRVGAVWKEHQGGPLTRAGVDEGERGGGGGTAGRGAGG